jgi:hypothetical protein
MGKDRKKRAPEPKVMQRMSIGRANLIILGASIVVLFAGYIALSRGPAEGFSSLTLAPFLLLIGYGVGIPLVILYRRSGGGAAENRGSAGGESPADAQPPGGASFSTDPGATSRASPKSIVVFAVALISFAVYLKTVAPTTTFWDAGELITCAHAYGIPHPPGAPLYTLVGRLFSILPLGDDVGFRLNLLSAVCSALTASLLFLIVLQLASLARGRTKLDLPTYAGGVVGALAFAFSFSQWANSVEAELYAPAVFMISLILWFSLKWTLAADRPGAERWILLVAYLFGLGMGLHLIVVLALPVVLLLVFLRRKDISRTSGFTFGLGAVVFLIAVYPGIAQWIPTAMAKISVLVLFAVVAALATFGVFSYRDGKRWLTLAFVSLLLVTTGYSIYATFYVRSHVDPILDHDNPDNPARFADYVNREQYGSWSIVERRAPLWDYQIKKMYVRYLGWQFIGKEAPGPGVHQERTLSLAGLWGLPFLLGLVGAVQHFRKDRRRAYALLLLFFMTGLAIVLYVNQEDPQARDRDYSYTGSFFAFSLWIGLGTWTVLELLQKRLGGSKFPGKLLSAGAALLLLLLVPGKMLAHNLPMNDQSASYQAFDFANNLLETCEPNALLFTRGDNDTYPLWYLQHVLGIRKDVAVINLSLLNTDWYVKKLRDGPASVPVGLSDGQIDQLCVPRELSDRQVVIPLPERARRDWSEVFRAADSTYAPTVETAMRLDLKASSLGRRVRPQDLVMTDIVSMNGFRRPVYFAVTTHPTEINYLDDYLRVEGLAFQLSPVPTTGHELNVEALQRNLYDVYRYRGQEGGALLQDLGSRTIFERYLRAFVLLAEHFRGQGDREKVREVLEKMEEVIDEEKIPGVDAAVQIVLGRLWGVAGREGDLEARLERVLRRYDLVPEDRYITFASFLQGPAELSAAESAAEAVLMDKPDASAARGFLIVVYVLQGRNNEAMQELNAWMRRDPRNEAARRLRQRLTTPTGSLDPAPGSHFACAH